MICPLPGCRNDTSAVGVPCGDCQALFGEMLVETDQPIPAGYHHVLAARDRGTREAQRLNQAIAVMSGEPERKPNQLCWMCERRKTCTAMPGGWECAECQEIQ